MATFLFVFCLCVSRISKVKNQRTITLPVVLMVFISSIWILKKAPGMDLTLQFYSYSFPIASFIAANLIPTLLLCIDTLHSKRRVLHET
ncbi:hypothetical protein J2736_006771 [Paenibacillus qinlingensis]|uniref:Uncharacterized protein n=1 Tax=Paenibacillus qinlingensis TaxID=1837343 RepID=A0ABU1P7F0_9BACL|nr:hypothetical protein [Paenibacillus qinlingensis]